LLVAVVAFFTVRYVGVREGKWTTLLPPRESAVVHAAVSSAHDLVTHTSSPHDH
jgi:hypothetical protein